MRFDQIIVVQQQQRAIDSLAEAIPALSRQKLKRAMEKGAVWLKKSKGQTRLRRATKVLQDQQKLHIYYDDLILDTVVPEPKLIADEKFYSVWDKPTGLLSQGTQYGDHCSLLRFAERSFDPPRPCFLVHRLDSDASGAMIVAHSQKAAAKLSELFQLRKINKRYSVTVEGIIAEPLVINKELDGKEALTEIETIENVSPDQTQSYLKVRITTGRKHQIRRHLAEIGHPVVGDRTYGTSTHREPLQLRAIEIGFECPFSLIPKQYELWNTL